MELRQPVDGRLEQLRMGMLEAVPARVVRGVAQAEVGPEIDRGGAVGDDRRDELGRRTVGQGQEDGVGRGQVRIDEMGRRREVRMDAADRLVISATAHETHDRHGGMAIEQPDELRADVAGRPDDRDPDRPVGSRPAIRLGRRLEARAHGRTRPLTVGRLDRRSGWIAVMDA